MKITTVSGPCSSPVIFRAGSLRTIATMKHVFYAEIHLVAEIKKYKQLKKCAQKTEMAWPEV